MGSLHYEPLDCSKNYLVTGAAGFIGFHLAKKLLEQGCRVTGIDNLNDYYDVNLKLARLEQLNPFEAFTFIKGDISEKETVTSCLVCHPTVVVNLAAQAGVRYSMKIGCLRSKQHHRLFNI
jgi:UDP-glucuronate 4-epimerase